MIDIPNPVLSVENTGRWISRHFTSTTMTNVPTNTPVVSRTVCRQGVQSEEGGSSIHFYNIYTECNVKITFHQNSLVQVLKHEILVTVGNTRKFAPVLY